jgi:HSP20 family molecular chaperone IbpA
MALQHEMARALQRLRARRILMHTRTDVFEHERELVLEIEVPGVPAGALEVTVDRACVVVSIDDTAMPARRWHRRERPHGVRARQIPLPCAIDPHATEIALMNGILTIRATLPGPVVVEDRHWTTASGSLRDEVVVPLGLCSR